MSGEGRARSIVVAIVLVGTVTVAWTARSTSAAVEDCAASFERARAAEDMAAVAALLEGDAAASCRRDQLDFMRAAATGWVVARAGERVGAGDPDAAEAVLTSADGSGMRLASSWRVNALLGDIASARERWGEAARQYGEAYRLSVEQLTPGGDAPNPKVEALQLRLFALANEALVLSGELSPVISRGGEPLGMLGSRGPRPRQVAIPVRFEFGEATFTPDGRDAVLRLAEFLRRSPRPSIELVGHTDDVGSAEFNQGLSERRAEAVAEALRESYRRAGEEAPDIVTRGEGETCPAKVSDPARYTAEQRDSLDRRVELVPDPSVAARAGRCAAESDR